jgi:hypothetical protein
MRFLMRMEEWFRLSQYVDFALSVALANHDIGPRHRRGHPCLRSIILSEPRKDIDLFVDQEGTTDQEEKYRKVLDGDGDCLGFGAARDGVG